MRDNRIKRNKKNGKNTNRTTVLRAHKMASRATEARFAMLDSGSTGDLTISKCLKASDHRNVPMASAASSEITARKRLDAWEWETRWLRHSCFSQQHTAVPEYCFESLIGSCTRGQTSRGRFPSCCWWVSLEQSARIRSDEVRCQKLTRKAAAACNQKSNAEMYSFRSRKFCQSFYGSFTSASRPVYLHADIIHVRTESVKRQMYHMVIVDKLTR